LLHHPARHTTRSGPRIARVLAGRWQGLVVRLARVVTPRSSSVFLTAVAV